uniref:WAP domain-containing protein n=1 Tax=Apteryx owenii TaxID=8824 RepID=A0A8B9P3Q6_APTOW
MAPAALSSPGPGYCPAAGSAGTDTCGTSCQNDTACGPGQKCCTVQPLRSSAACANQCADDRGCPGTHKCCFSGCGLACTPPYAGTGLPTRPMAPGSPQHGLPSPARASMRPAARLDKPQWPCPAECADDGNCPGAARGALRRRLQLPVPCTGPAGP